MKDSDDEFRKRLEKLERGLSKYSDKDKPEDVKSDDDQEEVPRSKLSAERIIFEIFGGILFGFFFGMLLDNYLNTKPLFILIFIILGLAGSIYNIYKVAKSESENT